MYSNLETAVIYATGMLIIFVGFIALKVSDPKEYFKTREGIGALSSALLGISAITIIGLFILGASSIVEADELEYFQSGGVWAGIETTLDRDPSSFCQDSGADPTTHSDLGAWINLFEYKKELSMDLTYSHNSCVLSKDAPSNDSVGIRWSWRIF